MRDPDVFNEAAWLVSRGVRALATISPTVPTEPPALHGAMAELEQWTYPGAIPFIIECPGGRWAVRGYAAHRWCIDLAEWLIRSDAMPRALKDNVWGLLHGYSAAAIASYDTGDGSDGSPAIR